MLIVTLDVKTVAFYLLGLAGLGIAIARLRKYRAVAASCLGGGLIVLGLLLVKEGAAPLAQQPWFGALLAQSGGSLLLAFLGAALFTAIVQSSSAVCVIGISLASVGAISVDQTIMVIYGSCLGSSAILLLLSAGLAGTLAPGRDVHGLVQCHCLHGPRAGALLRGVPRRSAHEGSGVRY